ncbi:MAG: hypothetical protein IKB35_04830 [Clostridia bacterium]|nr:hypothetical protein [Clostridia bacterium]
MLKRILVLFILIIAVISTGGVYATWRFAADSPHEQQVDVGITLDVFDYKPEEVLPGGELEEAPLGENHFALIDLILNESNKGYGLNYSPSVLLHEYLEDQRVVFCNQKVSGGNLKFILDTKNNTHGLYYCIEKISDTEYYAYTFSEGELATASGSSVEILAYRTILVKTDKWRATTSYIGHASVKSLREFGVSAASNSIVYSIDVTTWHQK